MVRINVHGENQFGLNDVKALRSKSILIPVLFARFRPHLNGSQTGYNFRIARSCPRTIPWLYAATLTWYALAKLAGIPNANTVRDIEYGRDAQISTVQLVAKAVGLRLDLVEEAV